MTKNKVKEFREALMLSKAELARRASVSVITLDRIENGMPCRLGTKRKILIALGKNVSERDKIFPDE